MLERGQLSAGHQSAAMQDRHALADALNVAEDMGGEQHGHAALLGHSPDELQEIVASQRVEPGRRLVEQQHLRIVDQRLGKPDLLAHAGGELTEPLIANGDQLELFEQCVDPLFKCWTGKAEHGAT